MLSQPFQNDVTSGINILLGEVRNKEVMCFGSNDLKQIACFLNGYNLAWNRATNKFHDTFLFDFQQYVQRRFDVSISRSWDKIISFYCSGPEEALSEFWKAVDDFIAERLDDSR